MKCPVCSREVDVNEGLNLEYRPYAKEPDALEVEIACPADHVFYAVYRLIRAKEHVEDL
jgi:hypothetical protein